MSARMFSARTKCKSCDGTGLYVGMAERDSAAVVCHTCKGTGCHEMKIDYEEFEGRGQRPGVSRVLRYNPGIMVGGPGVERGEFGGISYEAWLRLEEPTTFPLGSEMRHYSCPAWFTHQSFKIADCIDGLGRTFSECPHFGRKAECWSLFDLLGPAHRDVYGTAKRLVPE